MRRAVAATVGGAGLALGLVLLAHAARPRAIDASTGLPEAELADTRESEEGPAVAPELPPVSVDTDPAANLDAFLYAIRRAEHSEADVLAGLDWHTFYGGARFWDMTDHPVITGELRGVPLPAAWCARAGFADGLCVSTAAGALQFNVPTWEEVRRWGGPPLADFSPASQLEAGRRLLRKIGAAQAIEEGRFYAGLALAATRWASLPGSRAGQGTRSLAFMAGAFGEGLRDAGLA